MIGLIETYIATTQYLFQKHQLINDFINKFSFNDKFI